MKVDILWCYADRAVGLSTDSLLCSTCHKMMEVIGWMETDE